MKYLYYLFSLALCLSCSKSERPESSLPLEQKLFETEVEVSCKPFLDAETKSAAALTDSEIVTDISVFLYRDGKLVPQENCFYESPGKYIAVRFPDESGRYDIFAFANAGRQYPPEDESVMENYVFDLPSMTTMAEKGIPMSAVLRSVSPAEFHGIDFVRMFGKANLSFVNTAVMADYRILRARLCNCASAIKAFRNSAAESVCPGDFLSEDDVDILNDGGEVVLYFPENLQGKLLPGNVDPKKRIPSAIGDNAENCTYLEIVADVQTPTAHYSNAVFRAFLGANLSDDFSLTRNTSYRVNLDFGSVMLTEEEWRKVPGEYEVTGSISLSSSEIPVFASLSSSLSTLEVSVPVGAEYIVSIPGNIGKSTLAFSMDAGFLPEAGGKTVFCEDGTFTFTSSSKMKNTAFGTAPQLTSIPVTVETTDGVLKETVTVHLYESGFPIKFRYVDGYLWVSVENPLSVRMKFDIAMTCGTLSGEYSDRKTDSVTLTPGRNWTRISAVPSQVLAESAPHLPEKCTLSVDVSFPDGECVDLLNPSQSDMPFYIANMPDMIPARAPAYVRTVGQYTVNRGFDGKTISCPTSAFGPSDRTWHDAYVAAELKNVSSAVQFMVADRDIITRAGASNPTYLSSTDKYVVISSSGMDLGLGYTYGGNWYDFRNVMRLTNADATAYPVLAHFGHSLPYQKYEEVNRRLTFLVNSQSWWYAFGVNSDWFSSL